MNEKEYVTMTELGKLYGVSSHKVGKWLRGLSLRDEKGKPSAEAFNTNFVAQRPSRQPGTYFYVWDRETTTALLDAMQYPRKE
jgi:hypothetical protein